MRKNDALIAIYSGNPSLPARVKVLAIRWNFARIMQGSSLERNMWTVVRYSRMRAFLAAISSVRPEAKMQWT